MTAFAQNKISGTISDKNKEIIAGANVFIKNSYDGTSSNEKGEYAFETSKTGKQIISVSFIGYKTFEQEINLNSKATTLNIVLEDDANQMNTVNVTAGTFEASDKKKGTFLKPLDIVTTANTLADIYGAMNALPGTMKVADKGELFVRGGEGYETKTFVDGLLVQKPYSSTMPDLPSRGRFSPMLFSGTLFSTGGYSAEYGQAMSSALILNTQGLAEENMTSVSLMSLGGGLAQTVKNENTSLSLSGDYYNLAPYYNLVKQDLQWLKMPQGLDGNLIFRQKIGTNGLLKVMGSYTQGSSSISYPNFDNFPTMYNIALADNHTYINSVYNTQLNDKWILSSGMCYSYDHEQIGLGLDNVRTDVKSFEAKYTLNYTLNNNISIKFGNNLVYKNYFQNYFVDSTKQNLTAKFEDNTGSAFVEAEIKFSTKLAGRIGVRSEYSSDLKKMNVAPRLSLAYKTSEFSQVSLGYGQFYETPQDDELKFSNNLDFEKATHYILNYQFTKDSRIFRVETYYKKYDDLVKYTDVTPYISEAYNNSGFGYAKGVDVFWRDQKTFDNLEYWISYSYIDSKRNNKDYVTTATPDFVSNNNLTFIGKYYIKSITSLIGTSYSFTSGRTYYNPNNPNFMSDKTASMNDISLSWSYLTHIKDNYTILFVSVSNVLGFDNIYGYHYATKPDADGTYESFAIKSPAKRFFFIGLFISIK